MAPFTFKSAAQQKFLHANAKDGGKSYDDADQSAMGHQLPEKVEHESPAFSPVLKPRSKKPLPDFLRNRIAVRKALK